jgi:hypothetical protein
VRGEEEVEVNEENTEREEQVEIMDDRGEFEEEKEGGGREGRGGGG